MQYVKFLSCLRVISPTSYPHIGGIPTGDYPQLLIHYIYNYTPQMGVSLASPTQGHTVPWQYGIHSTSYTQKLNTYKAFPQQPKDFSSSNNPLPLNPNTAI